MREHIVINSDRSVTVPDSLKKIGIQYDHNVNTLTFDCPRYADDAQSIDMSKMQIFINWMLPDKSIGSSIAENIIIDEADSTLMHFDWIITSAVTPVFGILERTLVCIKQTDTDGREIYHWNTDLFQKFSVGEGMECNEQLAEDNMDVITQLLVRMDAVDTRTSTEAMRSYVSEYMTENPPQPSDEQANAGVDAYMTENGQDHVNTYMGENAQSAVNTYMDVNAQSKVNTYMEENAQEHMDAYMEQNAQNKVDDYLERNPLQLDNTLTDPTKAAPADKVGEIGTEVDELKGDLVDVEVLRTVNFLTSNSGFISAGGVYNSSSNFKITEPFEVKKGEMIKLTASGYNTSVSMITQWINDDYHPLVVCRSSNEEEYEYVAESDMEIILSYNSLLEYSSVIVRPIVSYVDSECKKLDDKIEAEKNKIIDVDFTGDEFGYYNPWGTFYDAPNFKHTKPFILYGGETVTLVASEYNDSISAIARYNGGVVTSLVRSTQTEETTYSYTAEEDMYIILCYNVFKNHYAKIKMTAKSQLKRSGVDFDEVPNYSMMFETMCGIGDSLMSGALSYRDSQGELQGKDIYGNSWLSTIARENGATRKHLSSGGKTTKAWITSYADELISDPVYSAYFIGLGTNDAYFKEYELGTINDDKGTDTFVGYYKDVIERVRAKAPNSAIFCLSLYSNATGYDAYSNMIEEITKLYSGVFFVDFINKSDVIIGTDGYSSAGHFTTLGYVRVAKNIKKIVNDVIKNNMSYFNMYAWDNTSSNR